ncbi:WYL domain-containing protein [Cryobacterium breve]|uniref:WYL domain-containing protein n=2 Tax=Cryobacterium TaxID=69578 RepID=A0ABY2JAL4_9MICO|nr:WYL domain-containing protein [Cryobacterium breve]TFC94515.1 WYL domain-containing protein [Cryobacterium sp. TmT3-12]TFD01992.1 WYL domain-containing protein [Cryobacterium breve]
MKAARLLSLLLVLQTRQRVTTAELAERLEVSVRTILRDVEALSTAGVPVYAERGRHGGIVLLPGARLNASHLEPAEMDSLSLAGLDGVQRKQLGITAAHDMAIRKIAARRAAGATADTSLAELVIVDNSGWLAADAGELNIAELALTLRSRPRLRIEYRSSGAKHATSRVVDPYGLASKSGRWYLVADDDHVAKLFNLDRLEHYAALSEPVTTRPDHDLRSVWDELKQRTEAPGRVDITVRLRESRVDLARRILGSRLTGTAPGDDGWRLMTVSYPDVESVRQLLQFGNHIEVIAPESARQRVGELATDLADRHKMTPA